MRTIIRLIFILIFSIQAYAQKVWEKIAPLPTPRYGMCSVVYQNKIWLIAGKDSSDNTVDIAECYDPLSDSWETNIPSLQIERFAAAAVVYRDTIFVIGGTDGNNMTLNAVEYFDPGNQKWKFTGSLTHSRGALTAVVLNDTMYAIGGFGQFANIRRGDVEFWDVRKKKWQISTAWKLSYPRLSMATVVVDSVAYTLGGISFDPVNFVENYQSHIGTTKLDTMKYHRFGFDATVANDTIFIIGGSKNQFELINQIEKYYPRTNEWSIFEPSLNDTRTGLSVESLGQHIYVFGGFQWLWHGFRPQMKIVDTSERILITSATKVEQISDKVPSGFKLLQNYPNPFNAQTTITFFVPENNNENIRLDIFNINGEFIKLYQWQSLTPGAHQIIWDGRNESGQVVTSGIYFYQLALGNYFASVCKMMLLR